MIEIEHNFDPRKFRWLFAKYVKGVNDRYHCTNCIRGPYSRLFSKHNSSFAPGTKVVMDELPPGEYEAVYICGVSAKGYRIGQNYPHNVHVAIAPLIGSHERWNFEDWTMEIVNGRLLRIPESVEEIPIQYRKLPPEFTTCRIFRWATSFRAGSRDREGGGPRAALTNGQSVDRKCKLRDYRSNRRIDAEVYESQDT